MSATIGVIKSTGFETVDRTLSRHVTMPPAEVIGQSSRGLMMTFTRIGGAFVFGLGLLSFGCATYVNIPGQIGDVASHNPNDRNVLAVEAQALRAFAESLQLNQPFMVRTLSDTESRRHLSMLSHVSEHASPEVIDRAPLIEVRQLYIRGLRARVDLVYSPAGTSTEEGAIAVGYAASGTRSSVVTAYLKLDTFAGWQVTRIKTWRMDVDKALQSARHAGFIVVD